MDQHDKEKLDDPLSKLEHHTDVMIKKKAQNERLVDLKDDSNAKYKNDYAMNKLLRKNLRYMLDELVYGVAECVVSLLNLDLQRVAVHHVKCSQTVCSLITSRLYKRFMTNPLCVAMFRECRNTP